MPVMPLEETAGSTGGVLLIQTDCDVPNAKAGVTIGRTVTVNVTGGAHGSAALVNVYTPLAVLLTMAGVHSPLIPLVEVAGKMGTASPEHMVNEVPKSNTGMITGLIVCV
jgi:hypothetical protein